MGTSSISVTLLFTPIVVALSRRKSTRLLAILGGLVGALGCLFTSFATQFHQLFFSFGAILGVGFGLTRGTSSIMVGQYFKKRREVAEIFVICGTGVGMAGTPLLVNHVVSTLGWRLGLQAMTGLVSLTFILGIFYRPASLYHPQRRAILHLKGLQKRSKAKDKSLQPKDSKPPFFDFAVLKSRTVQILIAGSVLSAFGIYAPVLLLMYQGSKEGLDHDTILHLQAYLGLGSALGTASLGLLVVRNSINCFVAKQYLVQACVLLLGLVLLGFMKLREPGGYVLFAWVYGFFLGGYMYALKTFTFEKVRARNFARAWGFVQGCQGVPLLIGAALTGYLNELNDDRIGFYFSAICIITGGLILYFIDVHKRNVQRQKSNATSANYGSERSTSAAADRRAYYNRRVTLQELADAKMLAKQHRVSADLMHKPELTCISEEAIMDNIFDDYVDDGITSCNKEEKYLMLSEFENNLINTQESSSVSQDMRKLAQERKGREEEPPMLEHCPNCFKVVPMDGGALCDLDKVESPKKTHVSRSSAKKHTFSRRKDHKTKECPLQNDIIDEATSSL
ncbi:hypothetical protein JTE90_008522 [Oedothorax gibbosus]|uniref:Major facilitator superfamily (MFS) profile domain-containing protein n=1 Tax=Oedothorax gibbosus TaxID=931172 RepID=A0AAV6VI75_9ARAC|nr:hypothetical protein JTE90_008522 [Oedothorax gibbosus]